MFKIGQRVVCLPPTEKSNFNDWMDFYRKGGRALEVGAIYTVRDIDFRYVDWGGTEPGLRLEELVNPKQNGIEPAYSPRRFRPVVGPSEKAATKHAEPVS